jgi:hypothetical protein
MSPEPDARNAPGPSDRPEQTPLGPLRLAVEGEARRVLSDAQIAPDPERVSQGWERRFVADESRVAEMVQLYHELGYETVVDSIRAADVVGDCGDCRLVALQRLKMIYTRSRAGAQGA